VSGGPFAAKRIIGRPITVEADIFADGHDVLAAELLWQAADEKDWQRAPLVPIGNDRWRGVLLPKRIGRHLFTIEAWRDEYATLCHALEVKHRAGIDVATEIADARAHLVRLKLDRILAALSDGDLDQNVTLLTGPETRRRVAEVDDRALANRHEPIVVEVERPQAEFASWYELFPRSLGTFDDVAKALPRIRDMGFDVLYFPPIHPIGRTRRKGRNNTLDAQPGDVGSPWAIGAAEGGHDAILAELGTLEDFRRLVQRARERGIEIALDIAFQCAPDHPWVSAHPEWFRKRADGSIQYAENPPKKYQDIYPFDFETSQWRELWHALAGVIEHWIAQGVRTFRVDNPHTKAFPFWEWAIARVRAAHPDVIFLSEAFTRPRVMHRLAKVGFSQSYTYFTWRNTKYELTEYFTELAHGPGREYFRPNAWPNTPDILPAALQYGGRAVFMARVTLAATLCASYGIYGPAYELLEARALRAGGEEYLDSEKFERRVWDRARPESLADFIGVLNRARRDNPALQSDAGLRFLAIDNEQLIAYAKVTPDRSNVIVCVVNLDPHHTQSGWIELDLDAFGLAPGQAYQMHDLLSDSHFLWHGPRNYVSLDPQRAPAHVLRLRARLLRENDFDYFL
jgi:starch synthase (maltosyl-transferring)